MPTADILVSLLCRNIIHNGVRNSLTIF